MQGILFICGTISLVLIFVFILWIVPDLQIKLSKADIKGKERIELKNKLRLTLAQILGGAIILGGLFFTWKSLEVSKEGQITERFTRAIEQLGNDKLQIRLGGIYALERIAKESKRDTWPIMEILTAYIRDQAPWREEDKKEDHIVHELPWNLMLKKIPKKNPPIDIQAILHVIGGQKRTYEENRRFLLTKIDLRGANLGKANLKYADFSFAHLEKAILALTNLEGASLNHAHLEGAVLDGAQLMRAMMKEAHLEGVSLTLANLEEAVLEGAHLEGASGLLVNLRRAQLDNAQLEMAMLSQANLERASLVGAKLKGCKFTAANLSSANLSSANLEEAFLFGAILKEADLNTANLQKATLRSANFQGANLNNAVLWLADLQNANLKETYFLTIKQLSKVKTLYKAKLDSTLMEQIKKNYPELLEKPKYKEELRRVEAES